VDEVLTDDAAGASLRVHDLDDLLTSQTGGLGAQTSTIVLAVDLIITINIVRAKHIKGKQEH